MVCCILDQEHWEIVIQLLLNATRKPRVHFTVDERYIFMLFYPIKVAEFLAHEIEVGGLVLNLLAVLRFLGIIVLSLNNRLWV